MKVQTAKVGGGYKVDSAGLATDSNMGQKSVNRAARKIKAKYSKK